MRSRSVCAIVNVIVTYVGPLLLVKEKEGKKLSISVFLCI